MRTKDAPLYNLTDFSVVQSVLTHLLPMHPFSTPWKQGAEKGGRETMHWEQMG